MANMEVTASIMMSESGFWDLTDSASATESQYTPEEDSLETQWTASVSLATLPSMSAGLTAVPRGTLTLSTVLPLVSATSMDLSPKEPEVSPRDFLEIPLLAAPSRSTVAEPDTIRKS